MSNDTIVRAELFASVVNSGDRRILYLNQQNNSGYAGVEYIVNGNEKYLNSGLLWPEGFVPKNPPNTTSFTVRFKTEGIYTYQCLVHPEMRGTVIVKSLSHIGTKSKN